MEEPYVVVVNAMDDGLVTFIDTDYTLVAVVRNVMGYVCIFYPNLALTTTPTLVVYVVLRIPSLYMVIVTTKDTKKTITIYMLVIMVQQNFTTIMANVIVTDHTTMVDAIAHIIVVKPKDDLIVVVTYNDYLVPVPVHDLNLDPILNLIRAPTHDQNLIHDLNPTHVLRIQNVNGGVVSTVVLNADLMVATMCVSLVCYVVCGYAN